MLSRELKLHLGRDQFAPSWLQTMLWLPLLAGRDNCFTCRNSWFRLCNGYCLLYELPEKIERDLRFSKGKDKTYWTFLLQRQLNTHFHSFYMLALLPLKPASLQTAYCQRTRTPLVLLWISQSSNCRV